MTWDVSERKQVARWLIASGLGLGILMFFAWLSPSIYPDQDPLGFVRQLFDTGGPVLLRAIFAMGVLLFVSLIEEGDWLEKVGTTEYGPTILLSVVLYCVLHG